MVQLWVSVEPFVLIAVLCVGLSVLHKVSQLSLRIDAIEIDRAWFTNKSDEQIQGLQQEVSELSSLVRDLVDFQKGEGRYRYDPDEPRLPAHIRGKFGRED